ncbi:filamentous hemagglutinin outer membrane protein [Actinobacillus seminis]|uniref:Filamentous hemagglutinin outer membrane protein n=1 Tax=Actinobacillus seminis TaxID=722 RepID=A0A380VH22_9PAST|nr:filamentous hemagglutinin outer membrane protein [Actinobacillus seminis]
MDTFHKNLCTIVVLSAVSTFSIANQPQNLPPLNQIDAAEKLRQQQRQQAQQNQLQHQADVGLIHNMNKQCFRVIFSKTLQRLVVTSELVKSEGKSTEKFPFTFPQLFANLRPLMFSLFCALGFVAFSDAVLADTLIIQADKSAPKSQQPIVLQTANGLPQVNIQTPNDKGLSHNKYSKFDVYTKGAILNNSHTDVQTQQAGLITGNPYLARGEAKVILNEVNSSDPSVLKGYVEVAGKKADVIIANPSGLHCEGCGIINSNRATFKVNHRL